MNHLEQTGAVLFVLLGVVSCGGKTDVGEAASSHHAEETAVGARSRVPKEHRPVAGACSDARTGGQCRTDSDCRPDQACGCARTNQGSEDQCVAGGCHVDSDCGPGGFCSPERVGCQPMSADLPGLLRGFVCHTPNDECIDDDDCGWGSSCGPIGPGGIWQCRARCL